MEEKAVILLDEQFQQKLEHRLQQLDEFKKREDMEKAERRHQMEQKNAEYRSRRLMEHVPSMVQTNKFFVKWKAWLDGGKMFDPRFSSSQIRPLSPPHSPEPDEEVYYVPPPDERRMYLMVRRSVLFRFGCPFLECPNEILCHIGTFLIDPVTLSPCALARFCRSMKHIYNACNSLVEQQKVHIFKDIVMNVEELTVKELEKEFKTCGFYPFWDPRSSDQHDSLRSFGSLSRNIPINGCGILG